MSDNNRINELNCSDFHKDQIRKIFAGKIFDIENMSKVDSERVLFLSMGLLYSKLEELAQSVESLTRPVEKDKKKW